MPGEEKNYDWLGYYFLFLFFVAMIFLKHTNPISSGAFIGSPVLSPTPTPLEGSRTSIDAVWDLYTNDKMEFFIKLPKQDAREGPVDIFEKDNIVYFVSRNSAFRSRVEEAVKKESTDMDRVIGLPWALIARPINTAADLNKFIKDRYGKDCATGRIRRSPQPGVYDVSIGGRIGPEYCFVNHGTVIKYSTLKKKVISWDLAQSSVFMLSGDKPIDQDMVRSFMFFR